MVEDNNLVEKAGVETPVVDEPFEGVETAKPDEAPKNEASKPDETANGETEAKDDAGEDDAGKPKRNGSSRKAEKVRILEAENARLARELEAMRANPLKAPTLEDFGWDNDKFEAAKTDYAAEKVARRVQEQMAENQAVSLQRERAELILSSHAERETEARQKIADYDATIAKGRQALRGVDLGLLDQVMLESEKSALLLHHLASRPEEAVELSRLPPVQMARRIGQLEARLSYPTARTETKAPPPVQGLRGGAVPNRQFSPNMSGEEYAKWREGK